MNNKNNHPLTHEIRQFDTTFLVINLSVCCNFYCLLQGKKTIWLLKTTEYISTSPSDMKQRNSYEHVFTVLGEIHSVLSFYRAVTKLQSDCSQAGGLIWFFTFFQVTKDTETPTSFLKSKRKKIALVTKSFLFYLFINFLHVMSFFCELKDELKFECLTFERTYVQSPVKVYVFSSYVEIWEPPRTEQRPGQFLSLQLHWPLVQVLSTEFSHFT